MKFKQYNERINFYVVKNMRLAGKLMARGFVLKDMKPDNDGSGRNVFLFNNSRQLIDAINEILSN
ncbi:DUF5659 domain-containing protein [Aneurinibacillus thermoaerophilus]|uniref:DUF5659 domain-containing protein n=1 Tax=Aneurinibacillus thermoaerophilus TaxID=143495 RepID=UPI002E1DE7E3|nr:DUF5659 domain-containing protein [Aneurinibacillus thermoaerophilus]MED0761866.1 DUF5659 domain-containing protein [Aneurinibacillus thermoaerophilus]